MPEGAPISTVKKVLFTALAALRDYLSDIVVVGGWVPQIYAWEEESPEVAVLSYDVDAAVARSVPVRGRKGISELMEAAGFDKQASDAGFALALFGRKPHQVTQFFYRKGKLEIPFEFIAPLIGRGEETSVRIQGDLVVPALRFTDILLAHTKVVALSGETLAGKKEHLKFKVPTLPAFVLAKGLIFDRRQSIEKKGKDLAYIYEVLSRPRWRELIIDGIAQVAAKHPAKWYGTFKRNLGGAFSTEGSAGPAWVALQYPQSPPAEMRKEAFQAFRAFLFEIE